ncbi:MAG TPA: HNH endonuclease, partial [Pyrinomonadaceae bacterium]
KLRERSREYYKRNPEKVREAGKAYKAANREKCNDASALRRARQRTTQTVPIRRADIAARDGLACYLCGLALTLAPKMPNTAQLEHVTPLSRGGTHTPENVKLACKPCNFRKHTSTPDEYLLRRAA